VHRAGEAVEAVETEAARQCTYVSKAVKTSELEISASTARFTTCSGSIPGDVESARGSSRWRSATATTAVPTIASEAQAARASATTSTVREGRPPAAARRAPRGDSVGAKENTAARARNAAAVLTASQPHTRTAFKVFLVIGPRA
jgi:hypothetical protein